MIFADSEAQKLLRSTARAYLADRFPWERLYALERGETLTADELRGLAERGWFALLAPESAGGAGASLLEAAAVVEEFGYAAVPAPVLVANVAAGVLTACSGEPARDALRALARGDRLYTVAERRVRDPEPEPGLLRHVPFAGVCDAVLAPLEAGGGPAFALVPLAGAAKERVAMTDGASYFDVRLDGAADAATVLARGDDAARLHERCDALTTALSTIELAGLLRRTMEMTGEYISNRVQFGQPIAKFQAARHRAAELLMQTETARWTAYHALWRLQQDPADTDGVWLAKHWAIRAAARVFEVSHLLHGGVGVGTEYPLHLLTQGIAAFAVRAGTMDEMVGRTIESIRAAS